MRHGQFFSPRNLTSGVRSGIVLPQLKKYLKFSLVCLIFFNARVLLIAMEMLQQTEQAPIKYQNRWILQKQPKKTAVAADRVE